MNKLKYLKENIEEELHKILFIDIETTPYVKNAKLLEKELLDEFLRKNKKYLQQVTPSDEIIQEIFAGNSALYPEFARVLIITVGAFHNNEFKVYSFYEPSEKELLKKFYNAWNSKWQQNFSYICGHNIKDFDIPFMGKRYLINNLPLPSFIEEIFFNEQEPNYTIIDTIKLWSFGKYYDRNSLHLLSLIFGIPTPKENMTGDQVYKYYWEKEDIDTIIQYGKEDVKALAKIFLYMFGAKHLIPIIK